jgi:MFS family permease
MGESRMGLERMDGWMKWATVACAGMVLGLALGSRHVQGLFMLPMILDHGWGRQAFSFAIGVQVLVWGVLQPLTGMLADKFGTARVIAAGCAMYALGLFVESIAPTPAMLTVGAGVIIGVALTATSFAAVYGGLARIFAPEKRGWAQGVAGAIGGFVQFLLVPLGQWGISTHGWSATLQMLALFGVLAIGAALVVDDRRGANANRPAPSQSAKSAMAQALGHRGFWLLNLGFVSCGFQLAFLGVHLPAYLLDRGLATSTGVMAIAIIALSNAIGTYLCGYLGDLYRRKYVLSIVYAARTAAMGLFLLLPLSPATVYLFAFVMGFTWLGTVPLTNGIVAQIFGVRYLGTLFGLVFLGHQLGGFAGSWLGGVIFDATRSYDWMWIISIALGLASVALNLPIDDKSVERRDTLVPA